MQVENAVTEAAAAGAAAAMGVPQLKSSLLCKIQKLRLPDHHQSTFERFSVTMSLLTVVAIYLLKLMIILMVHGPLLQQCPLLLCYATSLARCASYIAGEMAAAPTPSPRHPCCLEILGGRLHVPATSLCKIVRHFFTQESPNTIPACREILLSFCQAACQRCKLGVVVVQWFLVIPLLIALYQASKMIKLHIGRDILLLNDGVKRNRLPYLKSVNTPISRFL